MRLDGSDSLGGIRSVLSEINVTPFVDVMLVLLVIFMVTAPLIQTGIDVNLPAAKAKAVVTKEDPIVITVKSEKQIYIQDARIDAKALGAKLEAILRNRDEREVFLRADESVPYGVIVRLMAEVKEAGVDKLGMITVPPAH